MYAAGTSGNAVAAGTHESEAELDSSPASNHAASDGDHALPAMSDASWDSDHISDKRTDLAGSTTYANGTGRNARRIWFLRRSG